MMCGMLCLPCKRCCERVVAAPPLLCGLLPHHLSSAPLLPGLLPQQVVLSHTPFRQLATKFAHEPVLVAGRGQVRPAASWATLTRHNRANK